MPGHTDRVEICRAQVTDPDVALMLAAHFELMRSQSPPESCHVMAADELDVAGVHVFVLRLDGQGQAIGALKQEAGYVEIKSMHTRDIARGRGYARQLLRALIEQARDMGASLLCLETGSGPEHSAARGLYESEGFKLCPPFGAYTQDPLSLFMQRAV